MGEAHEGTALHEEERFRVIDCARCGFAHVDPRPSEEELAAYYDRTFLDHAKPDYLEKTERELDYWNRVSFASKERRLRRLLDGPGRILDVGSCGGFLLRHFRESGWEVQGVEPAEQAVAWARERYDLPVIQGFFERVPAEELGRFDAVHMAFVLEHVRDPAAILRKARELLRPGGLVSVEVPNDFNRLQRAVVRAMDKPRWWVSWPDHLNYFTFDSLERTLESCGFEVVGREATFPMELFLLMGEDYLGNDPVGRACHERRMRLELGAVEGGIEEPYATLYGGYAAAGLGREAIVYGRRAGER